MPLRSVRRRVRQRYEQLRSETIRVGYIKALEHAARLGRALPIAQAARRRVEIVRDLPYRPGGLRAHTLDVYRPRGLGAPAPTVLYIHGGAFSHLSKDTHWMMGVSFAARGYVVFNINYRLAPRDPFPAAVEDACAAARWVHEHAGRYGGDPERMVVAGESAGGNLATVVTLAARHEFAYEPGRALFHSGFTPRACIAACAILQVSETERFNSLWKRPLPPWVNHQLVTLTEQYLPQRSRRDAPMPLADPLVFLERREAQTDRPLPPFFAFAGTRDPILDDTRRLGAALDRHGVRCETRFYKGELHAFHAVPFREQARRCWGEQFDFLGEVLSA